MDYTITLSKDLFLNGKNNHNINLNIGEPTYVKWDSRNNIGSDKVGVYVIFDRMDADNWENPNPLNLDEDRRICLYVGEGKIRTRLNAHNNKLLGDYAGTVIYYEVPDTADRKILERLFIKHFVPVFNKENQHTFQKKKAYWESRNAYINNLIEEIDAMREEVGLEPKGKEIINTLFNDEDMSLNEIDDKLCLLRQGLTE